MTQTLSKKGGGGGVNPLTTSTLSLPFLSTSTLRKKMKLKTTIKKFKKTYLNNKKRWVYRVYIQFFCINELGEKDSFLATICPYIQLKLPNDFPNPERKLKPPFEFYEIVTNDFELNGELVFQKNKQIPQSFSFYIPCHEEIEEFVAVVLRGWHPETNLLSSSLRTSMDGPMKLLTTSTSTSTPTPSSTSSSWSSSSLRSHGTTKKKSKHVNNNNTNNNNHDGSSSMHVTPSSWTSGSASPVQQKRKWVRKASKEEGNSFEVNGVDSPFSWVDEPPFFSLTTFSLTSTCTTTSLGPQPHPPSLTTHSSTTTSTITSTTSSPLLSLHPPTPDPPISTSPRSSSSMYGSSLFSIPNDDDNDNDNDNNVHEDKTMNDEDNEDEDDPHEWTPHVFQDPIFMFRYIQALKKLQGSRVVDFFQLMDPYLKKQAHVHGSEKSLYTMNVKKTGTFHKSPM
ncbi:hypothetical protein HMI56_005613 [Coelomomyces lativittatus]|nr:hypothetical protein HMI56_005613 [Coelomomyces lativittatus]